MPASDPTSQYRYSIGFNQNKSYDKSRKKINSDSARNPDNLNTRENGIVLFLLLESMENTPESPHLSAGQRSTCRMIVIILILFVDYVQSASEDSSNQVPKREISKIFPDHVNRRHQDTDNDGFTASQKPSTNALNEPERHEPLKFSSKKTISVNRKSYIGKERGEIVIIEKKIVN